MIARVGSHPIQETDFWEGQLGRYPPPLHLKGRVGQTVSFSFAWGILKSEKAQNLSDIVKMK